RVRLASTRSSGRGRLPAWEVRIRSRLTLMPRPSGAVAPPVDERRRVPAQPPGSGAVLRGPERGPRAVAEAAGHPERRVASLVLTPHEEHQRAHETADDEDHHQPPHAVDHISRARVIRSSRPRTMGWPPPARPRAVRAT